MSKKKWIASDGKTELRPGMLVLVRDKEGEQWGVSVFAYWDDVYVCASNFEFESCIPLAGNDSLAGTDAPIPEPRQDAPQADKPLEWGERVYVWKEGGEKKAAIFLSQPYGLGYDVILQGRSGKSHWPNCERA